MEERNPAPWPSYGHVGIWYAERAAQQITDLTVPTVFLQRWWRQRSLQQQRIHPIVIGKRAHNVQIAVARLVKLRDADPQLSKPFSAYEKLDGTNLGVRCDGAVFGRRFRVQGDSYQKVSLKEAIPSSAAIQTIKESIVGAASSSASNNKAPMLVLYGELMCNPGKYSYDKRGMARKFFCFGAVFDFFEDCSSDEWKDAFVDEMNHLGFVATAGESGKVRLRMNKKLSDLIESEGIECAPLVDHGPLREVCFRLQETLMSHDKLEGVVLTGEDGCLFKWKTSHEDESKGHDLLRSLLSSHSTTMLELAGVDVAFVNCLATVAKKDPSAKSNSNKAQEKKPKTKDTQVYDNVALEKALESAMSKYDALEAYFERDERTTILANLNKELVEDLSATTAKEIKCIGAFVGKTVGIAFGKWKRDNT